MNRSTRQQGFTIIELMVATAVFAVVLVLVTVGVLQISRLYYKGVTTANTQNVARNIIDVVSQSIQFSGGPITPTSSGAATPSSPKVFCLSNQRFTYDLGWQVVDSDPNASKHQAYHGLVQDTLAGCTSSSTQNLDTPVVSGRELLSPKMRLSKMNIIDLGSNLYKIEVRVVYGDDDLLTGDHQLNNCKSLLTS